jgi:hypothetical protein
MNFRKLSFETVFLFFKLSAQLVERLHAATELIAFPLDIGHVLIALPLDIGDVLIAFPLDVGDVLIAFPPNVGDVLAEVVELPFEIRNIMFFVLCKGFEIPLYRFGNLKLQPHPIQLKTAQTSLIFDETMRVRYCIVLSVPSPLALTFEKALLPFRKNLSYSVLLATNRVVSQ